MKGYRTIAFALLFGLIQVAGLVGFADYTPTDDVSELVGIVVSIVVAGLRYVTDTPVGKGE